MKAEIREELLDLIRANPTAEVVLPDEYYLDGGNEVRTQIDGIKVMLHRWLYDQLNDKPLGRDRLRRKPEHEPRNVNPYLMERYALTDRRGGDRCRKAHLYSETGEFPPGRADRRRCKQCWRETRDRSDGVQRGQEGVASLNRDKTHCPQNHEYTPENTLYWPGDKGRRRCRQCETDRSKQRYAERKKASGNAKES